MCRMLALSARGRGLGFASRLLGLLVEAASNDKYLEDMGWGKSHCDGYGYVATVRMRDGGPWVVLFERFDAYPMVGDREEACRENLARLRESMTRLSGMLDKASSALVIAHARKTSREPRGVTAAHPFREEIVLDVDGRLEVGEIYLAHNGGVDKRELAFETGLGDRYNVYTDSHVALKYLAGELSTSGLGEIRDRLPAILARLSKYVLNGSALNLAIMVVPRSKNPTLMAYGYVKSNQDNKARWNYYRPIIARAQDLSAYMSSTIWDLAREELDFHDHTVLHGKLAILNNPGEPEIIERNK